MKSRKGKREGNKKAMRYSGGGYVSGNRVKSQINGSNTSLFNCATAVKYCAIAIISLLLCFVAIASAEEATNVTPSISEITSPMFLKLIGVIALILWVPFFVVFLALRNREKWKDYPLAMPKGSVRALLAFSLVVVIAIMLVLFRCFNEIISALLALLASIVGYYFGQRSVGAEPKEKKGAASEKAVNSPKPPKNESTTPIGVKSEVSQERREWIKLVVEGIKLVKEWIFREKPKTSEDIKKLHQTIEGLSTDVKKIKEEFADFKAEISNRLKKLEENAGAVIEDREAPENKKIRR